MGQQSFQVLFQNSAAQSSIDDSRHQVAIRSSMNAWSPVNVCLRGNEVDLVFKHFVLHHTHNYREIGGTYI